ncbi:MAG: methyltransferase domain-containing protein [Betaproteobacteria bacterium]|nr:methyltransferase domain-containing protein [Betaproteobacteria bacterium]
MPVIPFRALGCPLDGAPLRLSGAAWTCASGHSFDVASQGYTNLLPVQHKRSRDPGDSKDMVAARQRFLAAGFYQPIAAAVSRLALDGLPADASLSCLDAGCGEGYYLRQLAEAAGDAPTLALLGVDISKWAVLSAAKQDKRINWAVGSNAKLPVLPATLDRVLCLFGFPVYAEFARVLKPGGKLLQVDAGPDHLRELREVIYPSLKPDRTTAPQAPAGFSRLPAETLHFSIALRDPAQIADLLAMTPHLHRASAEGRARAAALTSLALSVDLRLTCFERNTD